MALKTKLNSRHYYIPNVHHSKQIEKSILGNVGSSLWGYHQSSRRPWHHGIQQIERKSYQKTIYYILTQKNKKGQNNSYASIVLILVHSFAYMHYNRDRLWRIHRTIIRQILNYQPIWIYNCNYQTFKKRSKIVFAIYP